MDIATDIGVQKAEFRGRVYDSIVDTIGATPLVRIHRLARQAGARADLRRRTDMFASSGRPWAAVPIRFNDMTIPSGPIGEGVGPGGHPGFGRTRFARAL